MWEESKEYLTNIPIELNVLVSWIAINISEDTFTEFFHFNSTIYSVFLFPVLVLSYSFVWIYIGVFSPWILHNLELKLSIVEPKVEIDQEIHESSNWIRSKFVDFSHRLLDIMKRWHYLYTCIIFLFHSSWTNAF